MWPVRSPAQQRSSRRRLEHARFRESCSPDAIFEYFKNICPTKETMHTWWRHIKRVSHRSFMATRERELPHCSGSLAETERQSSAVTLWQTRIGAAAAATPRQGEATLWQGNDPANLSRLKHNGEKPGKTKPHLLKSLMVQMDLSYSKRGENITSPWG